jgi:hypothetical protein
VISRTQRPLPDNTQHSQEPSIHVPAGFEPAIPESEQPQTYSLDRAATGIGCCIYVQDKNLFSSTFVYIKGINHAPTMGAYTIDG